jgi:hypothetical protein
VSDPLVSTLGAIEPFDDSTSNEARATSTIP